MSNSSRMLVLLSLLQARRDWPGHRLAERLEISERTVRRDVDRLRELGYRIHAVKGPDGGYRLEAGSELPPLLFDDEQAIVLAIALQTVSLENTTLGEAAVRALAAVRQVMPSRLRHRIDSIQVVKIPDSIAKADRPVASDVLIALSSAIRDCTVVHFDYTASRSVSDSETHAPWRQVQPHGLVARSGRWYLVGWDLDRDDWRIFRVDRIALRSRVGAPFQKRELPGGDLAEFVSGRFKGTTGDNSWPCQGTVILSLPAGEVTPYAGDGVVEDLGPENCRLTLGAWSWTGLAAAIGRFDADIQVIGPPELTRAFARLARRYADAGSVRSVSPAAAQ